MSNKIYLPRKDLGRRKKNKTDASVQAEAMQKSQSAPLISLVPGPDNPNLEEMLATVIAERMAGIKVSTESQDVGSGSMTGARINQVSVASSSTSFLGSNAGQPAGSGQDDDGLAVKSEITLPSIDQLDRVEDVNLAMRIASEKFPEFKGMKFKGNPLTMLPSFPYTGYDNVAYYPVPTRISVVHKGGEGAGSAGRRMVKDPAALQV